MSGVGTCHRAVQLGGSIRNGLLVGLPLGIPAKPVSRALCFDGFVIPWAIPGIVPEVLEHSLRRAGPSWACPVSLLQ